jgi:hypothetical protein
MDTIFAIKAKEIKPINQVLNDIFKNPNIAEWMIKTIQNRLYETGIVGTGEILKTDKSGADPYSPVTMDVKSFRGQKIGNVTLKDSGDFYKSFKVALNLFGFEISGDFQKQNGHIYDNFTKLFPSKAKFEESVMGLTNDEIDFMINTMIIPMIQTKIFS